MDTVFIALALVGAVALRLGYRWGWNSAIELYQRRTIEQANTRVEKDRI
jgi:hypothetical protein